MSLVTFNVCIALGWLMVVIGGALVHPALGLTCGGLLLLLLTFVALRLAGGLQSGQATSMQTPATD